MTADTRIWRAILSAITLFAAAASNYVASFTDSWLDTGATDFADAIDNVTTTGSFSVTVYLPLAGVDLMDADSNAQFSLALGPTGNAVSIISDTLGDASRFSNHSAKFPIYGMNAIGNQITVGSVTVSWNTSFISISGAASADVLGEEALFSGNSQGVPTNQPITGPYQISITLDASDNGGGIFHYENGLIPVAGHDRETEYNGGGFGPVPLETGSVSGAVDFTPPKLVITSPPADTRYYTGNTVVPLAGTVSDRLGVIGVECIVGTNVDNPFYIDQEISMPTNSLSWTAKVDLSQGGQPGLVFVTVLASDTLGNSSAVTRKFLWIQTNTAVLSVNPANSGAIKGAISNGQTLQLGSFYSVRATPASKDWIFADWTDASGAILSSNQSFVYYDTDGTLTANFIPNPFNGTTLAGTYNGLYYDTNHAPSASDAGYVTLTVTDTGSYSAKIYRAAVSVPLIFSGQLCLSPNGSTASVVGRVTLNGPTYLEILMQFATDTNRAASGAGALTGFVNYYSDYWLTQLENSAEIQGQLSLSNAQVSPGRYNIVIDPASADPSKGPGGYSYGHAAVNKNGTVSVSLNLADGVSPPISFSGMLGRDGASPLYASLYNRTGVILGWLQFATNGSGTVTGASVNWVRATNTTHTVGFAAAPALLGALYSPPRPGMNVLGWESGMFVIDPGYTDLSLPNQIEADVTFNPAKGTFSDSDRVAIVLAPAAGGLSGSFYETGSATATSFHGVVASGAGYGFYIAPNKETGPVLLQAGTP